MAKERKFTKSKNYRGKYNSNKGKKGQDRGERDSGYPGTAEPINDITDYSSPDTPQLLEQLNTYSFSNFLGVSMDLGTINSNLATYEMPNIMAVYVNPSVNYIDRYNPAADGINVEALRTYTMLSMKSGRTSSYAPQDVTTLLLAVGNIISEFSVGARGLGVVGTTNQRNRSYPKKITQACGFDYDELRANMGNYHADYNKLIQKFNQIPIPANIKYFEKCSRMFKSIYTDEDGSALAQTYVLMPRSQWLFDEISNPNGSMLKTMMPSTFVGYGTAAMPKWLTFKSYLTNLEGMIDALLGSTSLNQIYSDIRRLNEKDNVPLLRLDEIPYNYSIIPGKVEEISEWLNNAMILGTPADSTIPTPTGYTFTADNDVEPDVNKNAVNYQPKFAYLNDWSGFKPILNFKHEDPSLEDRVYSTRFYHQIRNAQTVTSGGNTYYVPTEVTLTDWYVTGIYFTTGIGTTDTFVEDSFVANNNASALRTRANAFTKFDWHPVVYIYSSGGGMLTIGDTNWYTTLEYDKVKALDDVCMMNLMRVR